MKTKLLVLTLVVFGAQSALAQSPSNGRWKRLKKTVIKTIGLKKHLDENAIRLAKENNQSISELKVWNDQKIINSYEFTKKQKTTIGEEFEMTEESRALEQIIPKSSSGKILVTLDGDGEVIADNEATFPQYLLVSFNELYQGQDYLVKYEFDSRSNRFCSVGVETYNINPIKVDTRKVSTRYLEEKGVTLDTKTIEIRDKNGEVQRTTIPFALIDDIQGMDSTVKDERVCLRYINIFDRDSSTSLDRVNGFD